MAFNGLLQGVMKGIQGGADAGVYAAKGMFDDQRKVDVSKQLADIEEEKLLRIDEVKRQRDIRDIPLKGAAETQVAVERGNNNDYLTAERNVAKAKHIESAGSLAAAALATYELDQKKKAEVLLNDLDTAVASGNQKEVDRITNRLNVIGGSKFGQRYEKAIIEDDAGRKNLVVVDKVTGTATQPIINKPGAPGNDKSGGEKTTRPPLTDPKYQIKPNK